MIFKNKHKKINDSEFGELKFYYPYWNKINTIKLKLFDKEYDIYIYLVNADTNESDEPINEYQRTSYRILINSQNQIIKCIENCIQDNYPNISINEIFNSFIPEDLYFSINGNFGLCLSKHLKNDSYEEDEKRIAIEFTPDLNYKFYDDDELYIINGL